MTVEWRPLRHGEVDHEALWSAVLAASALLGAACLALLGLPPIGCPLKSLTGVPCPTCGFGRGLLALSQGDVISAFGWNPLVPVGALGAAVYVMYALAALAAGRRLRVQVVTTAQARLLRWGSVVALAALWSWLLIDGR